MRHLEVLRRFVRAHGQPGWNARLEYEAGVLACGRKRQCALVFAVRASRRAETSRQPTFDRRGVRREKTIGGAQFIVRIGVVWQLTQSRRGQRKRLIDGVVKSLCELRIRCVALKVRAGLTQVVVCRNRALTEKQGDPGVGGQHAIPGGARRVSRNGLLEKCRRLSAIEVVTALDAFGPEGRGCGGAAQRASGCRRCPRDLIGGAHPRKRHERDRDGCLGAS